MSIPVCVVAYKNPDALARCIASLPSAAIPFVHDNTDSNIGLTRAINKLFRDVMDDPFALRDNPKYMLWLNQDVQLFPDAVNNAIAFMDAHPNCAVGGFKQLASDDHDVIIHGGTFRAWPSGVHRSGRVSGSDCAESLPMGWVNCAASIFRVEALKKIGLLDERFFLVGQDSDICLRAWANGYEVWYIADAVCLHDRGGCSSAPSDAQSDIIQKDMAQWSRKWLPVLNGITGAAVPIPAE